MARGTSPARPADGRASGANNELPGSDGRARETVYLHPGEVRVVTEPTALVTVLGSCVSVCLFDLDAGVGGMNHYLLPHSAVERSARFGAAAISLLLQEVLARGASRWSLRAKVFGGANSIRVPPGGRNLGEENAALAFRLLAEAGVPVLEQDVGGTRGRKLVFHTDAGSAWVRCL